MPLIVILPVLASSIRFLSLALTAVPAKPLTVKPSLTLCIVALPPKVTKLLIVLNPDKLTKAPAASPPDPLPKVIGRETKIDVPDSANSAPAPTTTFSVLPSPPLAVINRVPALIVVIPE